MNMEALQQPDSLDQTEEVEEAHLPRLEVREGVICSSCRRNSWNEIASLSRAPETCFRKSAKIAHNKRCISFI